MALGWKLHGDGKTHGPRRRRRARRTTLVGQDDRARRPARRGDVRRDVRLPADHGSQPAARDHDERRRDDLFLLIVKGKVPSYLGTSATFVGGVAAIRAQGADVREVTGAILVAGVILAPIGLIIHFVGSQVLHRVLPPVVTGAVVMLIGFNLAPVVAGIYWPQDQWVALAAWRSRSCVRSRSRASSRASRSSSR